MLACHCDPHQACHGYIIKEVLSERLQVNGPISRFEQIAGAAAAELFAGKGRITAALNQLGVKTAVPFERSGEDFANKANENLDLGREEVLQALLDLIWRGGSSMPP